MPTIKGEKSPSERFAGAMNTYTIEALMQNGDYRRFSPDLTAANDKSKSKP